MDCTRSTVEIYFLFYVFFPAKFIIISILSFIRLRTILAGQKRANYFTSQPEKKVGKSAKKWVLQIKHILTKLTIFLFVLSDYVNDYQRSYFGLGKDYVVAQRFIFVKNDSECVSVKWLS